MKNDDSFAWIDVLLSRWQIIVAIFGAVVWLTTIQFQLSAALAEQDEAKSQLTSFNEIKAEWPYLKEKVNGIDGKVDKILAKL